MRRSSGQKGLAENRQLATRHQSLGRHWQINPATSLKMSRFGNTNNSVARRFAPLFSRHVNPLARIWRILRRQPLPQNDSDYDEAAYQPEFEPDYLTEEYAQDYSSLPPARSAPVNPGFLGRPALRTFKTLTPTIFAQPAPNVQRNLNQTARTLSSGVENPDFSKAADLYSELVGPQQAEAFYPADFYPADFYPQAATYSAPQSFYPDQNLPGQAGPNLTYRAR